MNNISPLASVSPNAKLGDNVEIGPFAFIDDNVEIGDGCKIHPHAVVYEYVRMGKNCEIFPGAVVGAIPQDLKFEGEVTYVELGESPLGNVEGLSEYVDCAIKSGTHYLGFNFPLDICRKCGNKGVFDSCPECGSDEITRIRRVSGYLEILDYFVSGKKHEVSHRRKN